MEPLNHRVVTNDVALLLFKIVYFGLKNAQTQAVFVV